MNNDDDGAGPSDNCQPNNSIDPKSITTPATNNSCDTPPDDAKLWSKAGFDVASTVDGGPICWVLPHGIIAVKNDTLETRNSLIDLFVAVDANPNFWLRGNNIEYAAFSIADGYLVDALRGKLPAGISILTEGALIPLPPYSEYILRAKVAATIDAVTELELPDAELPPPAPDPVMSNVPLLKYSLQGKADELERQAGSMRPLLGEVCLSGQATIWYAPPNSGKTLIGLYLVLEAIREGRLEAGNVYYTNADDNRAGLVQKLRILQDVGAHMLVPGFKDFRAQDMQGLLHNMAQTEKARGVIVILDTIKKFASLMDKRDSASFADTCRQFVMHGGTVLAFAHTNKNPSPNGTLRYAGTTDFIEDFDAAYIITPLDIEQADGERVVRFDCIKRRGDSPNKVAYAYSTENGLTYDQLLASVEVVTFDKLGEIERHIEQRTDAELVEGIKACIRDGIVTKMHIASEAAKRTKTSGKGIIKILDRYTGSDPAKHHWTFTFGERGKHIYQLLPKGDPAPD